MAYEPDLITALIGANDMTLNSAAAYKASLLKWYAAVKAERPECRVAWSAPIPYNPNEEHPNYANFTAQRAIVMADARDPAVWGQWADYYLPLGEHPDWIANPPLTPGLWGDGVHPTGFDALNGKGGQNRLYDQFKAAMNTLTDASRASASGPYESVWPASETGLAIGTELERRFIVSGIAHTSLTSGIAVSGGDAEVRLNGGAWGTSVGRIYNGDVIDLKLTTSASYETATAIELTIGSETRAIAYTTAADVTPVSYLHSDVANVQPAGTTHTFTDLEFADGLALMVIRASGTNLSVKLTPSGGGETIEATQLFEQNGLGAWTVPIVAGTYTVVVTANAWRGQTTMSYGTVQNADPTPAQVVSSRPLNQSPPHLTEPLTVTANSLALVFFGESAASTNFTAATANSPTVLIDEGSGEFQSTTQGVAIGRLPESGQGSFTFAFGSHPRAGVVFAATG